MANALDAKEPDADDRKVPAKRGAKLPAAGRLAALKQKMAKQKGVRNPAALAAAIAKSR